MPNNKSSLGNRSCAAPRAILACRLACHSVLIGAVFLAGKSMGQGPLSLPEEYRPVSRQKEGLFFGGLSAAAGAIRLDEARTQFNVDGQGVAIAIVSSGVTGSADLP